MSNSTFVSAIDPAHGKLDEILTYEKIVTNRARRKSDKGCDQHGLHGHGSDQAKLERAEYNKADSENGSEYQLKESHALLAAGMPRRRRVARGANLVFAIGDDEMKWPIARCIVQSASPDQK
jgi:hypothetical protein